MNRLNRYGIILAPILCSLSLQPRELRPSQATAWQDLQRVAKSLAEMKVADCQDGHAEEGNVRLFSPSLLLHMLCPWCATVPAYLDQSRELPDCCSFMIWWDEQNCQVRMSKGCIRADCEFEISIFEVVHLEDLADACSTSEHVSKQKGSIAWSANMLAEPDGTWPKFLTQSVNEEVFARGVPFELRIRELRSGLCGKAQVGRAFCTKQTTLFWHSTGWPWICACSWKLLSPDIGLALGVKSAPNCNIQVYNSDMGG